MDLKPAPSIPPPAPSSHSPGLRNAIHFAVFFVVGLPLILIYRWNLFDRQAYSYWVAAVLGCGLLFNIFILKLLPWSKAIPRAGEPTVSGIYLYPFSLALTFLIFPLYAAFAAWAVLSCGDAAASFAGRSIPRYRLHWNEKKSYAGLLTFFGVSFGGALLSLWLMPCPFFLKFDGLPEMPYVWTLALLCAAAGAIMESIDSSVDDNVTIPAAVATTAVVAATFFNIVTHGQPKHSHIQPENLINALIANGILGALVLFAGFASVAGAALGMVLGTLVYFFANWQGYLLFTLFVAAGSGLSKLGWKRKQERHVAEANEGKRGLTNVAANLLVPTACCVLYPLLGFRPSLLIAFAGSLAAAFADTASSEIGVLGPGQPRMLTTLRTVPHGTNGAVSILGTFAAFVASSLMGATAAISGFLQLAEGPTRVLDTTQLVLLSIIVMLSGLLGTIFDSLLGATLEDRIPFVNKGTVNFACTLVGAAAAFGLTEAVHLLTLFVKL